MGGTSSKLTGGPRSRRFGGVLPWVGLTVSLLFAYLAVRHARYGEVWDGLRASNYWWLVPALAALAATVFLKALRWRFLFALETRPPAGAVTRALLVCYFFNAILPARAGEAARVLDLNQRSGTSRAEAGATVIVERAYDVLALLLLLFVAAPWLPRITWLRAAVLLAIVLAVGLVAAIALLWVFGMRPVHFILRPLRRLPFVSDDLLDRVGEGVGRGLAGLRDPRLGVGALGWTILGWLALTVSVWFVMRGFHLGLSFGAALLVVVATNLAQILPSSPSAVGVFEAATLVALGAYGIPDSTALSFALVLHALLVVPFLVAGLLLLRSTLSLGRRGSFAKRAAGTAATRPSAAPGPPSRPH